MRRGFTIYGCVAPVWISSRMLAVRLVVGVYDPVTTMGRLLFRLKVCPDD